jgi:hypothetical protein
VYVAAGGTFTMQGGALKNNSAGGSGSGDGGGVYVAGPAGSVPGGTFFMQGGTISGNNAAGFAANGGGVYAATGGAFVKATGAIYGAGTGNANNAAGSGSAVYVQGGRYRNDTVMDFLDSGKSINAGGWDYPVITHTYTDGYLEAGQVDWYVFTAPGGGAPLSVADKDGTVKVSAYRAYGAPISVNAAPPAFAAGETVYVKVEGEMASPSGTYSIRQGPLLLISNSVEPKSNEGTIAGVPQVDWYFFTAETTGVYRVMWEDKKDNSGGTHYTGDVQVSAYRYDATSIFGPEDDGYPGLSITLDAGETIYVKAEGITDGNGIYGIRYYPPVP